MSIKACAFRLLRNGRTLLRHFWANPASKDVVDGRIVSSSSASTVRIVQEHARRLLLDNVLKRVSNSAAAELRRRTAKRLLFGNAAPFLAFVGVNLASGTSIITEEDELEAACWGIRVGISCRVVLLLLMDLAWFVCHSCRIDILFMECLTVCTFDRRQCQLWIGHLSKKKATFITFGNDLMNPLV